MLIVTVSAVIVMVLKHGISCSVLLCYILFIVVPNLNTAILILKCKQLIFSTLLI